MYNQHKLLCSGVLMAAMAAAPAVLAADDNWSGVYLGASLGSRSVDSDWTTTSYSAPNGALLPFLTDPNAEIKSTAVYGGAFVGMNWVVAPSLLIGIEGSLGTGNNKETHTTIPGTVTITPTIYSYVEVNPSTQFDLVGRVGYLVTQKINLYGSVGFSALKMDVTATCPADTNFCNPAFGTQQHSESDTMTGWTAGIGAEMSVFTHMLIRLDARYADYGTFSFGGLPAISGVSYGFTSDVSPKSTTVTLGAAYKF